MADVPSVAKSYLRKSGSDSMIVRTLGRDHNAALNILRLGENLASKQNYVLASKRESCI
jgi:hypothetical protein